MACRINNATFLAMLEAERRAGKYPFEVSIDERPMGKPMVEYLYESRTAVFHKKPIQALVDDPEQARPIIRNLLRWADAVRISKIDAAHEAGP